MNKQNRSFKKRLVGLIALVSTLFLSSCDEMTKPKKLQDYLKENRNGNSPDYGVYFDGNVDDHIVTVHGFLDDHKVCKEIALMLEKQANGKTYSCRKLN